jgi:peroxiredoxin Q/BCP
MRWLNWTLSALAFPALALGAAPDKGSPAPDFELEGSDGRVHRLSDYIGRQPVVLAWFPKAFTGG